MDRRYRQARAYDGTRASSIGQSRRQALTRALIARSRFQFRSVGGRGYENGPKSIDPDAGLNAIRARQQEQADRSQIFRDAGSGVYGAYQSLRDAKRLSDPRADPSLG